MRAPFEKYLQEIEENPKMIAKYFRHKILDPECYLFICPPQVFTNLWALHMKQHGFEESLNTIFQNVKDLVRQNLGGKDQIKIQKVSENFITVLTPYILCHQIDSIVNTKEIQRRTVLLKYFLTNGACGSILSFFEEKRQFVNEDTVGLINQMLGNLLEIFKKNRNEIDILPWIISKIRRMTGQALFEIKLSINMKDVYQKMMQNNKEEMFNLLSKIKQKPQLFGQILSEIVLPENNSTYDMKLSNFLALLLIYEFWLRFLKEPTSKLKDEEIVEVIAEVFHRILYFIYDPNTKIDQIYITLLDLSSFEKQPIIVERISHHLIAQHKIGQLEMNERKINMIQKFWKYKLFEVKINEVYLKQCPQFIPKSQIDTRPTQEELEAEPKIKLSSQNQSKRKSYKPKRGVLEAKWNRNIIKDLKKLQLQKVFLLLQGLNKFIIEEWKKDQKIPSQSVLKTLVTIIKQIDIKKQQLKSSSALTKVIQWNVDKLLNRCSFEDYTYEQSSVGIGLFSSCLISKENKFIFSLDKVIEWHSQFNSSQNLKTVLSIKYLEQCIKTNTKLPSSKNIQALTKQKSFEAELFQLISKKMTTNYSQQFSSSMFGQLLSLKSANITNNLLINYAYYLFITNRANSQSKNILEFFELMNRQIRKNQHQCNLERIKLFLRSINIFEQFDASFNHNYFGKSPSAEKQRKFFEFLIKQKQISLYLIYAKYSEKFNFVKEAIFFTQLYCWRKSESSEKKNKKKDEEQNQQNKKKLLQLYSKMNTSFHNNLEFIAKCQNLFVKTDKISTNFWSSWLEELIKTAFRQIEEHTFKQQFQKYEDGQVTFRNWSYFYDPTLQKIRNKISELQIADKIKQNLILYQVVEQMLRMKQWKYTYSEDFPAHKELFQHIKNIQNEQIQVVLYKILIENLQILSQNDQIEQIYLQKLIQSDKTDELFKYLKQRKSDEKYQQKYQRFLIKYHYRNNCFVDALSIFKDYLEGTHHVNLSEIYQIELECKYKVDLNFTLYKCLDYLQRKGSKMINKKSNIENHFTYYFKIFRMIFNRYPFSSNKDNHNFLNIFFKRFIPSSNVFTQNRNYLKEVVFYLLRFLLEKFHYSGQDDSYGREIVDYFKGHSQSFVPYCNYLLKKVSEKSDKNTVIQTILIQVMTNNTSDCIWVISFVRNFQISRKISQRGKKTCSEQVIRPISLFYQRLWAQVKKKAPIREDQLRFLQHLTRFGLLAEERHLHLDTMKQLKVPSNLIYCFDPSYYVETTLNVEVLGSGKSQPAKLTLALREKQTNYPKTITLILKTVTSNPKQFRMESNVANFFSQSSLVDSKTTYKIFHLAKQVVILEFVPNIGTLLSLVQKYNPKLDQIERSYQKKKHEKQKGKEVVRRDQRLLDTFDNLHDKINIPFYNAILDNSVSIKDWWIKYTNYAKTCAQWSTIGYYIGLGDRHLENILMTQDCKLVHIDFQYAIDIGLSLPYPEWVPFRLTNCIVEPLGCLGEFGLFYSEMINVAREVQQKEGNLWKALSNFAGESDNILTSEIMDRTKFIHLKIENLEDGIAHIIRLAKKPELLRQMFRGWRSHI